MGGLGQNSFQIVNETITDDGVVARTLLNISDKGGPKRSNYTTELNIDEG